MKKTINLTIALLLATLGACTKNRKKPDKKEVKVIDVTLTDAEKAGGVLTPEILWKYGRIGFCSVCHRTGSTVLYTVNQNL